MHDRPIRCAPTVFEDRRLNGLGMIVAALLTLAAVEVRSQAQPVFTGRVVAVLDGDSLMVLDGRRQVEVRLHGVDAPEGGQAFGNVCKRTLSNLVFGKTAAVQVVDIDRYKRRVSRLTVDGRDVGLEMIRAGCAWHYRQYSDDAGYAAAEVEARRARRGLWQDAAPVAPWNYRRPQKSPAQPPASQRLVGGARAAETATATASGTFHFNVSSRVFHAVGCSYCECRNCTAVFATRDAAEAAGFRPLVESTGR
jgi:micrococcal nuclease